MSHPSQPSKAIRLLRYLGNEPMTREQICEGLPLWGSERQVGDALSALKAEGYLNSETADMGGAPTIWYATAAGKEAAKHDSLTGNGAASYRSRGGRLMDSGGVRVTDGEVVLEAARGVPNSVWRLATQ